MTSEQIAQCTGSENQSIDLWRQQWEQNNCEQIFYNQIYVVGNKFQFNPQGYQAVQNQMDTVFDNYVTRLGFQFGVPGEAKYNDFQEEIRSVCTNLPGSCNNALSTYCMECDNCKSRQTISSNLGTLNFCGCYSPRPQIDIAKITPECDPFCTRIESVPLPDNNGNALRCMDNVCVIDDVSINAAETTFGGDISFNQVCNACTDGCKCIISGVSISETLDKVDTTFNQSCGPNSICLKIVDGQQEVVDCKTSTEGANRSYLIWIVAGIIGVSVFLALLFFLLRGKNNKPEQLIPVKRNQQ